MYMCFHVHACNVSKCAQAETGNLEEAENDWENNLAAELTSSILNYLFPAVAQQIVLLPHSSSSHDLSLSWKLDHGNKFWSDTHKIWHWIELELLALENT